jgi:hypothetical protein
MLNRCGRNAYTNKQLVVNVMAAEIFFIIHDNSIVAVVERGSGIAS